MSDSDEVRAGSESGNQASPGVLEQMVHSHGGDNKGRDDQDLLEGYEVVCLDLWIV